MSKELLDDSSDYWQILISSKKVISGIIILIGMFFIYVAISDWYFFYYPRGLVCFWEPEIVYPLRLMASILTCFYGIRLFLEKIRIKTAIVFSIITLFGVDLGIIFFL